jgi:hypothetical protein
MKSFSLAKAFTLGCIACLALPIACGDDETTPSKPSNVGDAGGEGGGAMSEGGAGGAAPLPPGLSTTSKTVECGADMCKSVGPVGPVFIDPCCASDACGLDTGFLALVGAAFTDKCQAKDQPGDLDDACPTSDPSTIPFEANGATVMVPIEGFAGCCRANGTCGVAVNDVTSPLLGKLTSLGLGCVDAAPFFPGTTPAACGADGTGGAGGAGTGGAAAGGAATGGAATGGAADVAGASTGGAGGAP